MNYYFKYPPAVVVAMAVLTHSSPSRRGRQCAHVVRTTKRVTSNRPAAPKIIYFARRTRVRSHRPRSPAHAHTFVSLSLSEGRKDGCNAKAPRVATIAALTLRIMSNTRRARERTPTLHTRFCPPTIYAIIVGFGIIYFNLVQKRQPVLQVILWAAVQIFISLYGFNPNQLISTLLYRPISFSFLHTCESRPWSHDGCTLNSAFLYDSFLPPRFPL